jgi:hypothetical protein
MIENIEFYVILNKINRYIEIAKDASHCEHNHHNKTWPWKFMWTLKQWEFPGMHSPQKIHHYGHGSEQEQKHQLCIK